MSIPKILLLNMTSVSIGMNNDMLMLLKCCIFILCLESFLSLFVANFLRLLVRYSVNRRVQEDPQ